MDRVRREVWAFGLRGAALVVAVGLLAGCSSEPSPPPTKYEFTHAQLLEMFEFHAGAPVDCPDYLPEITADPGDSIVCYKVADLAAVVSRPILEELKPPAGELNADLGMKMIEQTTLSDDCNVDIILNGLAYTYGAEDLQNEGGRALFWFIDRTRCDDGSLIVLRTSG